MKKTTTRRKRKKTLSPQERTDVARKDIARSLTRNELAMRIGIFYNKPKEPLLARMLFGIIKILGGRVDVQFYDIKQR